MIKKNSIDVRIKNKIKQLLEEKKVKKTQLSLNLGYSKSFLNTVLGKPNSFFNLEHIEKICDVLDYPIAKLFADDTNFQEEQVVPATSQEEVLLEIYRGLSPTHKLDVIGFAGECRLAEAVPPRASKKGTAAP